MVKVEEEEYYYSDDTSDESVEEEWLRVNIILVFYFYKNN